MKRRRSKTIITSWKFISVTYSTIYYHQKAIDFCSAKSYWGSWSSWGFLVIGFSLRSSFSFSRYITIFYQKTSLRYIFKKCDSKTHEEKIVQKHISLSFRIKNNLQCWKYNNYKHYLKSWIKTFKNQIGLCFILKHTLCFTCSHSLPFVITCFISRCYSLSLVFTRGTTLSYSFSFAVRFVVTCCQTIYHSSVFL